MRSKAVAALLSTVLSAGVVGAALPAGASAGVPYTVQNSFDMTFPEPFGACDIPETVHIVGSYVLHVNATEEGLTEADIIAAFEQEDPNEIFNSLSFNEHGSFEVQSGVHTYTGTYTSAFGFNSNQNMDEGTYRFKATGKSEEDTQITAHFLGHGSETRETGFEKSFVKGCLPQPS
ncbi:MAG TPA: hypothetical protein VMZ73_08635 [Acidimicrobiales bacterium]|nr:hypothetical protein [Acidimicrobiales bacterium]